LINVQAEIWAYHDLKKNQNSAMINIRAKIEIMFWLNYRKGGLLPFSLFAFFKIKNKLLGGLHQWQVYH